MTDAIEFIKNYVRFPSVSTDPNFQEGMLGAQNCIVSFLKELGFAVELVKTPKHPIVLAERQGRADAPHVLLYGHYDVQPADPLELWESGAFEPEVRSGRLYGRGTADNKGPQMAMLWGLKKALEKNPDLPLQITVMIEGEEEIGSPSFAGFLEAYADRLKAADVVILSDTCSPDADQVSITTGLRGLMGMEVTLRGPKSDLHSGLHGGPVMNPIRALMQLCSSLHDDVGRVTVPGFYEDVLEPAEWERAEVKKLSGDEAKYASSLGVPELTPPDGYSAFESIRFLPTLEYNGVTGGYQGPGSKTIIPSKASVKITCRLVANQDPAKIHQALVKTLKERCPQGVTLECSHHEGAEAYCVIPPEKPNTPKDQPAAVARAFKEMDTAVRAVFPKAPLYIREGGSIPIIGVMKTVLGLDSLMLGLFTPADNLHAPNESMDLQLLERGIQAYAHFFGGLGK